MSEGEFQMKITDSANMSLQTMAIGLALMQAEVMKETGRLLGPEHFDGGIGE